MQLKTQITTRVHTTVPTTIYVTIYIYIYHPNTSVYIYIHYILHTSILCSKPRLCGRRLLARAIFGLFGTLGLNSNVNPKPYSLSRSRQVSLDSEASRKEDQSYSVLQTLKDFGVESSVLFESLWLKFSSLSPKPSHMLYPTPWD